MTYEIDHHYRNVGPEADLWLYTQELERVIATFYGDNALQHAEMFKSLLEQHKTEFICKRCMLRQDAPKIEANF